MSHNCSEAAISAQDAAKQRRGSWPNPKVQSFCWEWRYTSGVNPAWTPYHPSSTPHTAASPQCPQPSSHKPCRSLFWSRTPSTTPHPCNMFWGRWENRFINYTLKLNSEFRPFRNRSGKYSNFFRITGFCCAYATWLSLHPIISM